jgi:septal ring factor EnvC (AmiA/AmiB activator)
VSQPSGQSNFTPSQRAGLEIRHADQDRTLDAIHHLEAALGAAAPGREADWLDDVRTALAALGEATIDEQHNADQVDSLLSDVARNQPRLRNRVRGIRSQYQQVRDSIATLRDELAGHRNQANPDFADIRQRLAWLLTALRHQRSRESDLIYEAYYDAFKTDIEEDSDI